MALQLHLCITSRMSVYLQKRLLQHHSIADRHGLSKTDAQLTSPYDKTLSMILVVKAA